MQVPKSFIQKNYTLQPPQQQCLVGLITSAGAGEYFPPLQFTCRNWGGGDRGRVAIYRPFGEFRRAKSHCHLRKINLEVDSEDVQELLDSHNQELTMDQLIEMHEQEQDIEEFESLDPVQSED
ncbi:hypothetical protein TNCV_261901 [Trichonephila clavipes]|nr:hypothetical protein TNCV_261901 [Trichonephila clavipes]